VKAAKSAKVGFGMATEVGKSPDPGRPGKIGGGCPVIPGTARAERMSAGFGRPKNPFPFANCL